MYKCRMEKGKMIFTGPKGQYIPGGKFLESMDEVVAEHELIQEIIKDHGWAFPVIEELNRRRSMLLENLMTLYKRFQNGRNIQHSENSKSSSIKRGSGSSADDERGAGKAKKTQGQE